MGRMQDALRKAAEERERRRMAESGGVPASGSAASAIEYPRAEQPSVVTRALERQRAAERALAPVPEARSGADERLVVHHAPTDPRAEEFRKIRASLMSIEPRPHTILITSGARDEGKSLMASNLALALLETGDSEVLLIDANLRHPELAQLLGAAVGPGLCDLIGTDASRVMDMVQKTSIPGLCLLPAGETGVTAARQLRPDALKPALLRLRERFEFIIIDSPAATDYADPILMSNDVDGVLVVVSIGNGRRAATVKVVDDLETAKARLLGTVVLTGS